MDRIQELVDEFVANLLERESSDESDVANEFNLAAYQALKELYSGYGESGLDGLSKLLSHDDETVRGEVARILLHDRHEESKAVLEDFAGRPESGLIHTCARSTLAHWNDGKCKRFFDDPFFDE